jgi:hypothetical protein
MTPYFPSEETIKIFLSNLNKSFCSEFCKQKKVRNNKDNIYYIKYKS